MSDIGAGHPNQGDTLMALNSCMEPKLFPCQFANSTAIDKRNDPIPKEQNTLSSNESKESKSSREYLRRFQRYREIERRIKLCEARKTEYISPINNIMVNRDILETQRPAYNVKDLIKSYKLHAKKMSVSFNDMPEGENLLKSQIRSTEVNCFRNNPPEINNVLIKREELTPQASNFTNNTSNAVKDMLQNIKKNNSSGSRPAVIDCEKLSTFNLLEKGYKDTRGQVNEKVIALDQSVKSLTQLLPGFDRTKSEDNIFHVKSESLKHNSKNHIDLDSYRENEFKLTGWSKVRENVERDINEFKVVLENSCQVNTLDIVGECSLTKGQIEILATDDKLHRIFTENRLKSVQQEVKIVELEKKLLTYEEKMRTLCKEIENLQEKLVHLDVTSKSKDLTITKQSYLIQGMKETNNEINAALNGVENIMDHYRDHF